MSSEFIKPELSVETKVSSYDRLNGFLISALMLVGFLVAMMFLVWLTMIIDFSGRKPVAMVAYEEPYGNEKPEGFEDDIFEPGVEEFPEVDVPQLKDALEAVTEAVSSVQANLEARDGDAAEMGAEKDLARAKAVRALEKVTLFPNTNAGRSNTIRET